MNQNDLYTYPAVMTFYEDGDVEIFFPDLNAVTQGHGKQQACVRARDLLELVLHDLQEESLPFPKASSLHDLTCIQNEQVILIDTDLNRIRLSISENSIERRDRITG